jgi:hypothetical protein
LSLTAREAVEQLNGLTAIELLSAERMVREAEEPQTQILNDPRGRTDEVAVSIADTPHLTGDPEWDAIELAETDPMREPLRIVDG